MTKGKRLLMYIKDRLPLLLLLVCVVSCAIASAVYAKYVKDIDTDISMNISGEGNIDVEVVNADGKYTIRHTETSRISAYVRFAVVVNWTNDNKEVYHIFSSTDCIIDPPNCTKLEDGYYYYNGPLPLDAEIKDIVVTLKNDVTPPSGFTNFNVQILVEAIQCVPEDAVKNAWGVSFENGAWK